MGEQFFWACSQQEVFPHMHCDISISDALIADPAPGVKHSADELSYIGPPLQSSTEHH